MPLMARMLEQGNNNEAQRPRAKVVAVTSGKAGVGKTSLAFNVGCELSRRGYRTVLIDADLGLASPHILTGARPEQPLADDVSGAATLADVVTPSPCGLRLVRVSSRAGHLADLDDEDRGRICRAVEQLRADCDVILLDTAAGAGRDVTDFVALADETVLVTTNNFAAIADACGVVEVLDRDGFDRPVHAVVNRARSAEEAAQVFAKLRGCTERFLGFELKWLGLLPEHSSVEGAASQRTPLSEAFPGSAAARYLAELVSGLERRFEAPRPVAVGAEDGLGATWERVRPRVERDGETGKEG